MANWLPLDVLRLLLDFIPPVARGRTILASVDFHRTLSSDSTVWNRIWSEMGFYLTPPDRHQLTGEAFSSETSPTRLDLSKCARAVTALKEKSAFENLHFRKVVGIPSWLQLPDWTTTLAVPSFCSKVAGFGVTIHKTVAQGSFSDDFLLDDLFLDVSRIRGLPNQDLPVVDTGALKKANGSDHYRSQVLPVGGGSSFLLHQTHWGPPLNEKWTMMHVDQKTPGNSIGSGFDAIGGSLAISNVPPGLTSCAIIPSIEMRSRNSSSKLIVQLFGYTDPGTSVLGLFYLPTIFF